MLRPEKKGDHFDELAANYAAELPRHLRERLVERKTLLMRRRLNERGAMPPARGLDFGCGQGWYACEMAAYGYAMNGVDVAAGQVREARVYASARRAPVCFEHIHDSTLPFADSTFDFIYAINVLHHVVDESVRRTILSELVRVLKPGGIFFLHEINTANLLFRFYMSYVYPLLRAIDEGTEFWIHPDRLPQAPGGRWETDVDFFTFLPDFLPGSITRLMAGAESRLEQSRFRRWSAHYVARFVKESGCGRERRLGSPGAT
jgi:2-polyprenyl-3-methyl-5-hydroxy-6-metoxy-1,4-benzoquinol methylase